MATTSHTCLNAKKVKEVIKTASMMNTSAEVFMELNQSIGTILSLAIDSAKDDGRKTVMGRDIRVAMKKLQGA